MASKKFTTETLSGQRLGSIEYLLQYTGSWKIFYVYLLWRFFAAPEEAEIRGELFYDWGPKSDQQLLKKSSRHKITPAFTLYVGNLPLETTKVFKFYNFFTILSQVVHFQADLKFLCQRFGRILKIKVQTKEENLFG